MEWNVGLQNYKKCSLDLQENCNHFTTELLDVDFERGRDIADIFYDHLANRQTKYVEVLRLLRLRRQLLPSAATSGQCLPC